jgi:hypothetical protein
MPKLLPTLRLFSQLAKAIAITVLVRTTEKTANFPYTKEKRRAKQIGIATLSINDNSRAATRIQTTLPSDGRHRWLSIPIQLKNDRTLRRFR